MTSKRTHPEDAFDPFPPLEGGAGAGPFLQSQHPVEDSMLGRAPRGIHGRAPHLAPCPPINLCKAPRLLPTGASPGPSPSSRVEERLPTEGTSL